jgi:hypothetical protein
MDCLESVPNFPSWTSVLSVLLSVFVQWLDVDHQSQSMELLDLVLLFPYWMLASLDPLAVFVALFASEAA